MYEVQQSIMGMFITLDIPETKSLLTLTHLQREARYYTEQTPKEASKPQ
jgi:hypothetical protein